MANLQDVLNEISYIDYKKDESVPQSKKVNLAITEINKMLTKIENIVRHSTKLKNETNVTHDKFWKSSKTKLCNIAEKLIRISNNIKKLGS